MLTFALSATITLIILEYICKFLKLRLAIRLYQELLEKPNIIYLVKKIIKPKYKDLVFLILDGSGASIILKTIIFVNNIDEAQHIVVYFYIMLSSKLQKKRIEIICTFFSNLESAIQQNF